MSLEQIVAEIKQKLLSKNQKPILIGIEGYGGAGKTTFAENLKQSLGNAYVINFDDFLIKEKISNADKSGFDKGRLEEQVLAPAKRGEEIKYQRLEWTKNKLSEAITVPECYYLIIEGISCYHPSVADYYDFKIWIQAPMETAKRRGSKRDRDLGNDNDRLWEEWAKTDLEYQVKYHPEEQADFIFENL